MITTIEKIKAEIERKMKFYDEKEMKACDDSEQGDEDALWYQGHRNMCAKLLSFISDLEKSENLVPNDLEEAANAYSNEHNDDCFDAIGSVCPHIIEAFIAGAKWQKEQDMDEWIKDRDGCFWDGVNEGKKAMKEQMLKEAVEGRIHGVGFHNAIYIKDPEWTKILDGMNECDKIRILCLKEDEK